MTKFEWVRCPDGCKPEPARHRQESLRCGNLYRRLRLGANDLRVIRPLIFIRQLPLHLPALGGRSPR